MDFNRRSFLQSLIATGVLSVPVLRTVVAGVRDDAQLVHSTAIDPPLLSAGGDIVASRVEQEVWRGTSTPVWTLGGSWPAPTIMVDSGETFSARLVNDLDEPTIIHWHGLEVPADMDGHPRYAIDPGGSYDYQFVVNNRAGTYFYHPHPHMATARQVYMGMAGFFIVHDLEERALNLPAGEFDVPLLLQDRRLGGTQTITYAPAAADLLEGFLGDTMFVNGRPDARRSVKRGIYRFRLLNGSNARVLTIAFADGRPFHVIGTDGGLLDKPYEVASVQLATAERVEVVVDFSQDVPGSAIEMLSTGYGSSGLQARPMSIMHFDIESEGGWTEPIPASLATIQALNPDSALRSRSLQLRMIHDGGARHVIGAQTYDMGRVDFNVQAGSVEIWDFVNLTAVPHPMHIHNAFFQLLTRNGQAPTAPVDFGWKDTVLVNPTETVRIIVRFGPDAGLYMAHCHALEHADEGMMINVQFDTGPMSVDDDRRRSPLDLR